ncbi:hypothetical protein N9045_00965 [bacterium]|nr:hypothetical protein [bacterium]
MNNLDQYKLDLQVISIKLQTLEEIDIVKKYVQLQKDGHLLNQLINNCKVEEQDADAEDND